MMLGAAGLFLAFVAYMQRVADNTPTAADLKPQEWPPKKEPNPWLPCYVVQVFRLTRTGYVRFLVETFPTRREALKFITDRGYWDVLYKVNIN